VESPHTFVESHLVSVGENEDRNLRKKNDYMETSTVETNHSLEIESTSKPSTRV
jgi:hypothetical protein